MSLLSTPIGAGFKAGSGLLDDIISYGSDILSGSPMPVNIPDRGLLNIGPNPDAKAAAIDYAQQSGIPYTPIQKLNPVDAKFGAKAAREYELMRHDPTNRFVKESYDSMKQEVAGQYEAMLRQGITPEFDLNPYPASPYESLIDLIENKRLKVFPTSAGYGPEGLPVDISQNPMLEVSPYMISGKPATYNDLFRAVHDFQGHSKTGAGFRAAGEDNAYLSHAGTMTPLSRRALATETRGQNSLLNFGPDGVNNRTATIDDTIFADQKIGNLPNYITEKGTPELYARQQRFDQLRSSDNTRLEGAVDDAGNLRLVHYSPRPIERVDPYEYGKGLSGRTIQERNRAASPDFVNRNFYGIEADQNPYRKEYGLGQNKVETQIDAAQVYDAQKDPEGLWKKGKGDSTLSEKAIFDAGYSGYFVDNKQLGKVAAIFDPLDVTNTLNVSLLPLAGLLGVTAMGASEDADAGVLGKAKGLLMDTPSRMARAKEQGFDVDTPVYHGTSEDFDSFDPDRAIGTQFWSTTNKAEIESGDVGAQGSGVIKEMYHKIKNPAGWEEYDKFGIDELISRGYDGLKLPDGNGNYTYTAFDPSQYRSVDAAFDPAKTGSSNLLASNPVATAGAVGMSANANGVPQGILDFAQGRDTLLTKQESDYINNAKQLQGLLGAKDNNFYNYGDIAPLKRHKDTGDYSLAMTGILRDVIEAGHDALIQPQNTGITNRKSLWDIIL